MDYRPLVSDEDTPITEDLADERTARAWADAADIKRPWRSEVRALIADAINRLASPPVSVLELGCGPGLLAEVILGSCEVSRYFASDYSAPMLAMSRERLARFSQADLLPLDFKREELLSKLIVASVSHV